MDKSKRNVNVLLIFCTFILIFIGYKYDYFEIIPLRPPAYKEISSTYNHINHPQKNITLYFDCGISGILKHVKCLSALFTSYKTKKSIKMDAHPITIPPPLNRFLS